MNIVGALKTLLRRSFENPATPLSDPANWLIDSMGGGSSAAGIRVGVDTALTASPIWRGVTMIARDVAKLPTFVYKRNPAGKLGKEKAKRHPAYRLLRHQANDEQTAFVFKYAITAHAILWGNGYGFIDRDRQRKPGALVLLDPAQTSYFRAGGRREIFYSTRLDDEEIVLESGDVFHLRGLPWDGMGGVGLIGKARESVGLHLGAREFGSRFFSNDASPRSVIETDARLSAKAKTNIAESWGKMHQGVSRAHRVAILDHGMKLKPFSMSPEDALLIVGLEWTVRDIANFLGVPPHKLGDTTKTSFASLEQENQAYVDDALDGWLVGFEAESWAKLLTARQQAADSHLVEFLRSALIRADIKARFAAYQIALQSGIMSPDEIRDRENLNPEPDGIGDVFFRPMNLQLVGPGAPDEPPALQADEPPPPPEPGGDLDGDDAEPGGDVSRAEGGRTPGGPAERGSIPGGGTLPELDLLADAIRRAVRFAGSNLKATTKRTGKPISNEWTPCPAPRGRIASILRPVLAVCGRGEIAVDRAVDRLVASLAARVAGMDARGLGAVIDQLAERLPDELAGELLNLED